MGVFVFNMEKIKILSGCDGHLIGVFDNYTISDYETKHGVKCKLYEIEEANGYFSGYNDYHYIIREVFQCDGCGEHKSIKERFQIVDENFRPQKGMYECADCRGL